MGDVYLSCCISINTLKRSLIILFSLFAGLKTTAQKIDSIYFNLYTDSLKKGTYNYINVEGRYTDGRYLPLGDKELKFTASGGKFSGNNLFIDTSFREEKVKVRVVLNSDTSFNKEMIIYIKKHGNTERLRTVEEIFGRPQPSRRKRNFKP